MTTREPSPQSQIASTVQLFHLYHTGMQDFRAVNSRGADLRGFKLRGADLSYGDLGEA
jgi:uncharacterized protein YjbI with pentapeptide repeats